MQFKHLFLTVTFFSNLLLTGFAQEPTLLIVFVISLIFGGSHGVESESEILLQL